MKQLAKENRFSETAFAVKRDEHYMLRWFTPGGEIDLCGHDTLAAAYALFRSAGPAPAGAFSAPAAANWLCRKKTTFWRWIFPRPIQRLGREEIVAYQASERGGTPYCGMDGDRVRICGKARLFSAGELLPDGETQENAESIGERRSRLCSAVP